MQPLQRYVFHAINSLSAGMPAQRWSDGQQRISLSQWMRTRVQLNPGEKVRKGKVPINYATSSFPTQVLQRFAPYFVTCLPRNPTPSLPRIYSKVWSTWCSKPSNDHSSPFFWNLRKRGQLRYLWIHILLLSLSLYALISTVINSISLSVSSKFVTFVKLQNLGFI